MVKRLHALSIPLLASAIIAWSHAFVPSSLLANEHTAPPTQELTVPAPGSVDPYRDIEEDRFRPITNAGPLLKLSLPVRCHPSDGCFVLNYFDRHAGPEALDLECGPRTYNNHHGVDFALPNLEAINDDHPVIAAADGLVMATRDTMPDVHMRAIGEQTLHPVGLGNTVVLRHDQGIRTIYGHLRRGSVRVEPGQAVKRGDVLGMIGLSGISEYPHVHFEVRIGNQPVDPYGTSPADPADTIACGVNGMSLFTEKAQQHFAVLPAHLLNDGFSDIPLNHAALLYGMGERTQIRNINLPALYYQVQVQGLQTGDQWILRIIKPDGTDLSAKDEIVQSPRSFAVLRLGIENLPTSLPGGIYTGLFVLRRTIEGQERVILQRTRRIRFTP